MQCKLVSCGDGKVDPREQCDDGNQDNSDACTNMCKSAACGDGYVWSEGGEECDGDSGLTPNTACTGACKIECEPQTISGAWGDCDNDILTEGCDEDLTLKENCGVCGHKCELSETCVWNGSDRYVCIL
jgi:cysteine-rich repeat protein